MRREPRRAGQRLPRHSRPVVQSAPCVKGLEVGLFPGLLQALGGHDRKLTKPLKKLADNIDNDPSKWSKADRELAGEIMHAWYLGRIGDGPGATVVTYEHALMFDAVSDALKPRTFCATQPGLWATKPA